MLKFVKKILIVLSLLVAVFFAAHFSLAANIDVGLNYAAGTGLSAANDPRIIAANIIRIALGFLGIIAVGFIIYAGWLWMTADGQEEKIEKAKKILISACLGLLICLASFAIASFILSKLIGATTGGGDGTACDPPCGQGQYCCNNSCSESPCGGVPDGDNFIIRSTIPKNSETEVIRNVAIRVFFNKAISNTVSQAVLGNNFKVEKIAAIDSVTKAETPFGPALVTGALAIDSGRQEINFKSGAACGNEENTPNCFPDWSKFMVTVNGLSGLISANGQSLNCSLTSNCQFVFSTSNIIDTSGPEAGILPVQICRDDGALASIPDANLVNGWARDDIGVADIKFCSEKSGNTENCFSDSVKIGGLGQTYLSHSYKYDTSNYQVGDDYIFRVKASDAAAEIGKAEFSAKIRAGHCCNGVKDQSETDVDCGGECGACDGAACANDMSEPAVCSDNLCASQVCRSEVSVDNSCAKAGYAAGTESCCLCQRPPVITGLSPRGGFCSDNINKACLADNDCGVGLKCDVGTPNGAAGNFFTVHGKNFGIQPGKVFISNGNGGWLQAKLANDLTDGNNQCGNNVWTDSQIIAIVPAGAETGPVKVETISGLSATSDKTGQPDFKINNINRPGLCLLNPDHGKQDQTINYNGIKLSDVDPYFGNLENKIAGLQGDFNNKNGTAKVPNLAIGKTTSFVIKDKTISNFLSFTKEAEADKGPFISSFEPGEGAAGQYVTINGRGFGRTRGLVYFGDMDGRAADFDFPQVCADSIWSDEQVIVKVPAGLADNHYKITMKISSWPAIDTTSIKPPVDFKVDNSLPLKPSLCKINPIIGQPNSQINLYGEYFERQDGNSKVRFQLNKDQTAFSYWRPDDDPKISGIKPDKIITTVPVEAVTGPVRVVKGSPKIVGNGLNFKVGTCQKTADCGSGDLCCPAGTPYAGQCKTGEAEQDVCFPEIKACVYEWNFSTKGSACSDNQQQCGFSCCNKNDSCDADFDNGTGKCDGISCAPGVITCGNQCCPDAVSCDIETGACPGQCAAGQVKCEIPNSPIGNPQFNCCNSGQCNQLTGQCDSCSPTQDQCGDGSCCSGISKCRDADNNPETPTECIDALSCAGYGNQCSDSYFCPNSPGKCSANAGGQVIGTGVKCGDEACGNLGRCLDENKNNLCSYNSSLNKCVKIDSSCDLPQTISDINGKQVELKCGLVDGKTVWHYNSSQTCVSGYDKSVDKAKCLGASCSSCSAGFVCQKDDNKGVCAADASICPIGSSCDLMKNECVKTKPASCECCCNKTENTAGGSNPGCCSGLTCGSSCGAGGDFGLCSGCTVAGDQAASNAKCNCTGTSGKFCDMNGDGGRGVCLDCAALANTQECSSKGAGFCCVDAEKNNACRSGTDTIKSSDTGDKNNYCAYYECQTAGGNAVCNGPVVSSALPTYKTQTDCQAKCTLPPQFGQQCSSYNSVNGQKTAQDSCDLSQCANFSCLNEDGSGPTPPNACGTCCCDPKLQSQCAAINPKLSCYADKGSCSGANRGLCCGCSKDNECGDSNVGCGGDTCCQARPKVIETAPADGANKVCRNSLIKVTFNQAMQISTFNTNIIVIGEYGASPCPDGAEYLTAIYKPSVFARIKLWLAKLPLADKLIAAEAKALTGNYCSVAGKASGLVKTDINGAKTTDLEFRMQKALEANRKYYVIIKGDSDITDALSNGVLSQAGIGMKAEGYNSENPVVFNGLAFANAKIWSFTTIGENEVNEGICTIDNVKVNPSSYVFQTDENDDKDDNQADKENFNTIADSDLVFSSQAYANNGQLLTATQEYSWQWTWKSANEVIAKVEKLAEPEPFKAIVRAQKKITDGQTEISATADFSGLSKTGQAKVYVFLCKNIWPSPKRDLQGNLIWEPWRDNKNNCTVADKHNCGNNRNESCCYETNYELYYCRDNGTDATADDLPAILSDKAVIRPYDSDKQNILKEFYFFREDLPLSAEGFSVRALERGGSVLASWSPVAGASGYKVYYGAVSGKYTASADSGNATSKEITGLVNGRKYYFALTSYNDKMAESDYTKLSESVIPNDTEKPGAPVLSGATVTARTADLSWPANQDDTAMYKVYYGATSGALGASVSRDKSACANGQCELKINNLNSGTSYFFAITAIDRYKNESDKSGEINLIIK